MAHTTTTDKDEEETAIPVVSMDYGYLNEEGKGEDEAEREGSSPMLVVKEWQTRILDRGTTVKVAQWVVGRVQKLIVNTSHDS